MHTHSTVHIVPVLLFEMSIEGETATLQHSITELIAKPFKTSPLLEVLKRISLQCRNITLDINWQKKVQ